MKKNYSILFLLIFYFFFQLSSIDYGTKINNIYDNIKLNDISNIKKEILSKERIIENKNNLENNNKNLIRYKLYSIEADEMLSIMALSKIAINKKIDPHYYQYGGSFLYPLGVYYYFLKKINLIKYNNIDDLLKNSEVVDNIYIYGRIFVLLTFIISAFILFKTFRLLTSNNLSLKLTTLYLFVPSSIMFSQIIKPHWFSLIWINLIIYNLIKLKKNNKEFKRRLIYISIFMGFCIGSALYNIFFLIISYIFLFFFLKKDYLKIKNISISLLFILIGFITTNPTVLINSNNMIIEFYNLAYWFKGNINFTKITNFFQNSLITGFGLVNIIFLVFSIFLKKNIKYFKSILIFLLTPLIIISIITAQQNNWHINFRYLPYFLPILLLFFLFFLKKKNQLIINSLIIFTFLQMIPLKIAYMDENNEKYSTRIKAANWIEKNINKDDKICNGENSLAPFNMPPIKFYEFNIVNKKCDWIIMTIRNNKNYEKIKSDNIKIEFLPRYLIKFPRTVYSHINPIIVIIKS
mgnify:CR=1 FL=1|tara:strand:+ start:1349 stop:2914 length:1566 start_codon:yes stop_codon:yes gene_type:complete